jgi:L-rhamnose isomerase / sugar isomerase
MVQTVMNIQRYHAQALVIDRKALKKARAASDVIAAENTMQEAFNTDVDALLEQVRIEDGRHPDPLTGYAESGYQEKIETERQGEIEGAASWG